MATAPAKRTARKSAKTAKPPTTAGGRGKARSTANPQPSPFQSAGPEHPDVRYTLTAICNTAQDIADGTINVDVVDGKTADEWHAICPVATLHGGRLTICNHEWHVAYPRCWICKTFGGGEIDLDPVRRCCQDREACADRANARLHDDPRFERYRQYAEMAALDENGEPKPKRERKPAADRPTSGRCQHCGEPTKGGKFVAGHDAKLKGDLMRLVNDHQDPEALAELMLRPSGWYKSERLKVDPGTQTQADEIVQKVETETYLAERSAERMGVPV